MRIVDENSNTITEYDLSLGSLIETQVIKEGAEPINNVNKFAWADDDYEDVLMYIPNPFNASSSDDPSPQDDMDAMLVDHEYRLTLLELGITESEV